MLHANSVVEKRRENKLSVYAYEQIIYTCKNKWKGAYIDVKVKWDAC